MKKIIQAQRALTILFAFLSIAFFVYDFFVFWKLNPKMVAFESLSGLEESMLTWVGIGLVLILIFFLLSLLQIAKFIKHAAILKPFPLFLVISGILSVLFVFSDVALLSDIHKQYRHGLAQPEWSLLYPMMALQAVITLAFTVLHLSGALVPKQVDSIARDNNIFLVVQYVGLLCGLMGLAFSFLGFLFPHGWTLLHTAMNMVVLLFPYALVVLFWLVTKLREVDRQWFDEKQRQDIGRSALLTLVIDTACMVVLFFANYQNLVGIVSLLWLPLHFFGVMFLFSLGNIFFSNRL